MFGVVPKTPVMTGITVALTFHNFCHSILNSRYLSTFFVLPEDNVLISWYCHIYHQTVFFLLWTQCLIALLQLPALILKPYWSLHLSIHSRTSGIYLYVPAGFYIQHCTFYKNLWSFFATVSCLIKNWFFVKLVQATTI